MNYALSSFHHKKRDFFRCSQCFFFFVPKELQLSEEEEKLRYQQHDNNAEDVVYQEYLERVLLPLKNHYDQSHKKLYHLDYGAGKTQTAENILKKWGLTTKESFSFDLYFSPEKNPSSTNQQFDLITALEVVEHFTNPARNWQELMALVKNGGDIFIQTQIFPEQGSLEEFSKWWYKNDPTHVSIYSPKSLEIIAKTYQLSLVATDNVKYVHWRKYAET